MVSDNPNLREKCKYFPCHTLDKEEFDCRTCYCPFYEVCFARQNGIFGGYWLKNTVWACEKCEYIHRHEVVEKITQLEEQGLSTEEIYDVLVEEYKRLK
ncbi:MAG: hypothetical protein FWC53_04055 [Firmicutes bacterium]|nr:hypothetical protein [Bacillota bacterium]